MITNKQTGNLLLNARRAGSRIRAKYREFRIKRIQQDSAKRYPPETERLIVFFTPGRNFVCGGILSIASLYEETTKLHHIHGAEVAMCTLPGEPLLLKYTKFHNQNYLYSFSSMLSRMRHLRSLLIHLPEYAIGQFLANCSNKDLQRLKEIDDLRINIMIQNIELLGAVEEVRKFQGLGKVSCTTAHRAYSTPEVQGKLGCPLHELSTYVSPEQYDRRPYLAKEDLIVVSPDQHACKAEILGLLAKELPTLRVEVIEDLSYEEYKGLIARAKWSLTFGEGLDGYFLETIFAGGIGFGVYNTSFFIEDFKGLRTLYPSYEVMPQRICSDIRELDDGEIYIDYQMRQFEICSKYYNFEEYLKNLSSFYERYFPSEEILG